MNLSDIGQIVAAAVVSVGGVAGIIVLAVKFSSNILAERLSQKYELKLNKKLEEHKTSLDKKNYISRAMFDREFEIYQSISNVLTEVFYKLELYYGIKQSNTKIIKKDEICIDNPRLEELAETVQKGAAVTEIQMECLRKEMCEQVLELQRIIDRNASFIAQDNFVLYSTLCRECRKVCEQDTPDELKKVFELKQAIQKNIRDYLIGLTIIN